MYIIALNDKFVSPLISESVKDTLIANFETSEYVELTYSDYLKLDKTNTDIKNIIYVLSDCPKDALSISSAINISTPDSVVGNTALSTTPVSISLNNETILFKNIRGNIWINFNAVAAANNTSFLLTDEDFIRPTIDGYMSIISDANGANYQYIILESGD